MAKNGNRRRAFRRQVRVNEVVKGIQAVACGDKVEPTRNQASQFVKLNPSRWELNNAGLTTAQALAFFYGCLAQRDQCTPAGAICMEKAAILVAKRLIDRKSSSDAIPVAA